MNIRRMVLVTVGIALCGGATAQAQWKAASSGTFSYVDIANWTNYNNDFSPVNIGSGTTLTLTFAGNTTLPNFALNFDYTGGGDIELTRTNGNATLTLGANSNLSFQPKISGTTNATGRTLRAGTTVSGTARLVNFSLSGTRTFTISAGNTLDMDGVFQGAGTLILEGGGLLKVKKGSASNVNPIVNSGTYQVTASAWSPVTNSYTANDGGTFLVTGSQSNATSINLNGGVVRHEGTSPWSGFTLSSTGGGNFEAASSGGTQLGNNVSYVASGGTDKTLTLSGTIGLAANRTFTVANGTQATDVDVTGVLSGGVSVTKQGAGVMRLGGANTYTGPTSAAVGVLLIDGSTAAGSAVSVASGAVFGGDGTVNDNLTLANGALFAFDVGDTLTLGAGSTFALNSSFGVASLRDRLGAAVNWASVSTGTHTLITGGNLSQNFFSASNIDNFGAGDAFDIGGGRTAYFANGSLALVVAVPEPSAVLLGGFGLVLAGWLVRRRR